MAISIKDAGYLGKLQDYHARHGVLPSYSGLGEIVGFRAKNAATKLAKRFIAAGLLKRAPGGKLAPTDEFFGLPLMNEAVRAGSPETIDGQVSAEHVTLNGLLCDNPSRTVLLPVKGDSMRDLGVLDGDIAVVERADTARSGQLVVAIVDDEFTFKELGYEKNQPVLIPHNPEYSVIRPVESLQIYGVVRGVVRRYPDSARLPQRISGASL